MLSNPDFVGRTDSYKVTHWKQYPPGTQKVYSYFESRGGVFDSSVFFGLQYYLEKYLSGSRVTTQSINRRERQFNAHFGQIGLFNRDGWEHIVDKHGGKLPLVVKAVPEGTVVPIGNVLMTVENTDDAVPWLTNYAETLLSKVWYPTTIASADRKARQILKHWLDKTGTPSKAEFMLHDFGYRGVSSEETAEIGGGTHSIYFKGTDTWAAIDWLESYYGAVNMPMFSIPASEHSTITSWGEGHEHDAFENMLEQYPEGLVACVSDSYDIYKACSELWGKRLKDKVLARNGTLVIRPDSGNPCIVVIECLDILWDAFGGTTNDKGYKVLDPHIRLIQGDGIDINSMNQILEDMDRKGFSADNIAFGSGGALLQKVNRDTMKFAFKCSAIQINDKWLDVYKSPKTDPGKTSKRGLLKLVYENGTYSTMRESERLDLPDQLIEVFRDGMLTNKTTLEAVRGKALSDFV